MNPVRVKIVSLHEWPRPEPWALEWVGHTGTVVWAEKGIYELFGIEIELDEPIRLIDTPLKYLHAYYLPSKGRWREVVVELIDGSTVDDLRTLARFVGGNWMQYRQKNGDPMPWSSVSKLIESRMKKEEEDDSKNSN